MTREEAINLVKQVLPCLNIDEKIREGFETLIPELRKSEDERIRMALIKLITVAGDRYIMSATGFEKERLLAYLEKDTDYLSTTRVETFSDGTTVRHSIGYLEKGEERKPAELGEEDDQLIGFIFDLLNGLFWRKDWAMSKEECLERLKSLRSKWKHSSNLCKKTNSK